MNTLGMARVVVLLMLAVPPGLVAQDELVDRGNVAYQEGDYAAAIEAYEAVLAGGFTSAGLEYNLGNAYFKSGALGPSILHWERALVLSPGDPDTRANLELARSITADAIEPMPTFWLVYVANGWVNLIPTSLLLLLAGGAWLVVTLGVVLRVLGRDDRVVGLGRWSTRVGIPIVVVFGGTLLVRDLGIGRADRGVVLVEAVAVRSAPANDDDLTLFEVHEGTRVRIDQQTGSWVEVVLDDGKVGWIPIDAMEMI
jgi:hypothetical protein